MLRDSRFPVGTIRCHEARRTATRTASRDRECRLHAHRAADRRGDRRGPRVGIDGDLSKRARARGGDERRSRRCRRSTRRNLRLRSCAAISATRGTLASLGVADADDAGTRFSAPTSRWIRSSRAGISSPSAGTAVSDTGLTCNGGAPGRVVPGDGRSRAGLDFPAADSLPPIPIVCVYEDADKTFAPDMPERGAAFSRRGNEVNWRLEHDKIESHAADGFCRARTRCGFGLELRPLSPADRSQLLELLRRQRDGQLHAGVPESYGSLLGVPVALFGVFFFTLVLLLAGVGGRDGVAGARRGSRLRLRHLDRRPGVHSVSRVGVVRAAENVLHAVRA